MNILSFLKTDKYHKLFKINEFSHTYCYNSFPYMVSQFHMRMQHEKKNIKWLRGENSIHTAFKQTFDYNNDYIDHFPLKENDAMIISLPFFLYGDVHPLYDWYMTECTRLGIPVALDLSLIGSCDPGNTPVLNFSYGCIQEAWCRLRYSNFTNHHMNFRITKYPISFYDKIINTTGDKLEFDIPEHLDINEVIDTYKRSPITLEEGFKSTSCIHILKDLNKLPEHNRDGVGYTKWL